VPGQDDYPHWARHKESDASGKLLLLEGLGDGPDTMAAAPLQMFFDDNVERDRGELSRPLSSPI